MNAALVLDAYYLQWTSMCRSQCSRKRLQQLQSHVFCIFKKTLNRDFLKEEKT